MWSDCLLDLGNLLLCLLCLLPPFTVPWKMVLARSDEQETCPYHCSLRLFTMDRRSSGGLIACLILAQFEVYWVLNINFLLSIAQ